MIKLNSYKDIDLHGDHIKENRHYIKENMKKIADLEKQVKKLQQLLTRTIEYVEELTQDEEDRPVNINEMMM